MDFKQFDMENDITINRTKLTLHTNHIGSKLSRIYFLGDDANVTTIGFDITHFFVSTSDDGLPTQENYLSRITIYRQDTKIELYVHIGLTIARYNILDMTIPDYNEHKKAIVERYADFINERIIDEILELRVICGGV